MKLKIGVSALIIVILLSGCSSKPDGLINTQSADDTAHQNEQTWIGRMSDDYDLTGMRLAWCTEIDLNGDGGAQLVSLYLNAARMSDGSFMFDDGQDWALLLEDGEKVYPLFERKYVQLGSVSCSVFRNEEDGTLHILVKNSQGAGMEIYDCVYDKEKDAFLRTSVYSAANINFFGGSERLGGDFYNPKLNEYKDYLIALPRSEFNEAIEAFEKLLSMTAHGEILPDGAVDAFLDFHAELLQYTALNTDFEALGYNITPELKSEYAPYFIRLYQAEGTLSPATDFAGIADVLYEHVDWEYSQYFDLMRWLREEKLEQLASDAGLVVSWEQLADLIVKYHNFAESYPLFAQRRGLDEQLERYTSWYLETGLDNTPIRERNGALRQEIKASYEYFMEAYPDSPLFEKVKQTYEKG